MNLVMMLKRSAGKVLNADTPKMRSIVMMQRQAHRFSEDELHSAAERGWGKKFDGIEDPMYFVSADRAILTIVKAGPHIIRVTSLTNKYADDDKYALSHLPQPEQKMAWTEHQACTFLHLFNDLRSLGSSRIPDKEAYASLAKLALQLGDPNCAAIFIPTKNLMMPNDGSAEEGLRLMISKDLPFKR